MLKPLSKKMINFGYLSDQQIENSLEEQRKRQTKGDNIRLGDLLVEQGEISPQQLETSLDANALDSVSLNEDAVRLAIRLKTLFKGASNLILFTDSNTENNASKVASQVAHALTLIGDSPKTLLIDANFHAPTFHETFSQPLCPGLAEIMIAKESLDSVIMPTCVNKLFLLTAGKSDSVVLSHLVARGFKKLFDEIRQQYPVIIVATSSILDKSEAILLASEADQVIAVAAKGAVTKTNLRDINKLVTNINSQFSGVILCQNSDIKNE